MNKKTGDSSLDFGDTGILERTLERTRGKV